MIEIDLPDVVHEVGEAADAYERALADGDTETLVEAFWDSALALRFGDDEELFGHDAISRFRRTGAGPVDRTVRRRVVTAYGRDVAGVHLVADYPEEQRVGRQSQLWLRTDDGWRVAQAHVSWPLRSVERKP